MFFNGTMITFVPGQTEKAMEAGSSCVWVLFFVLLLCTCQSRSATVKNFTVGEDEGWTANPSVPYSKWASDKNFTVGDFLSFAFTDPGYNVIRTYNETVYKSCDYMSSDSDFDVWTKPGSVDSVSILLIQAGPTYFFCGANDSKLCLAGMKLGINVSGDGLPASLAIPPPAPVNKTAPSLPTSPSGDGGSISGTHDRSRAAQYMCPHWQSLLLLVFSLCFGLFWTEASSTKVLSLIDESTL